MSEKRCCQGVPCFRDLSPVSQGEGHLPEYWPVSDPTETDQQGV